MNATTLAPDAAQHLEAMHTLAADLVRATYQAQTSVRNRMWEAEKANEPRPAPRAWVNGKTVWIQVWRKRVQVDALWGLWYCRTSRYPSNAKRRATIAKWKAQ